MLIGTAGAVLWLLVFGFVLFAGMVMRDREQSTQRADGIVVLTGGPVRIAEGARLLGLGRGQRLLISGVNPHTGRESLIKISRLRPDQFDCCVDLGYEAMDTAGNAGETRAWAAQRGYSRLLIVTSRYHMPRSLAELARAMPGVQLIPHPVAGPGREEDERPWWLQPATARVLASEYLKFLPAAARLWAARAFGSWENSSLAEMPEAPRSKT